jgi:cell division septum initiation protein DivIVA
MVNTINEFQERNKQLLEENENLKKQLTDKEQEFKLRILNAVNNVMENERSEIAGTLMTLQQHF